MVAQQRHAVFNLVIASAALLLFLALIPQFGISKAQAGFALLGFTGLGPFFFRRRAGQVVADERDREIFLRAAQISFAVFWLLFVFGVMGAYHLHANRKTISIDVLPLLVWLAWSILQMCHSAVLLIVYRWS